MKIDWFRKEFKDKYNSLRKQYLQENDEVKRRKILEAIKILYLCLEKQEIITDIHSILENDYLYLTDTQFLWEYISKIDSIDDLYIDRNISDKIKFNKKELIELIHIFFKDSTNKDIYSVFNKIYNDNKKNIHIISDKKNGYSGETIYLDYFKKTYIQIFKNNTFNDVATLAHEFGHAIQFYKKYDISAFGNLNIYIEIISSFFELLCREYFSTGSLQEFAVSSSYIDLLRTLDSANNLEYEFMLLDEIKIDKHENKLKLRENIDNLINKIGEDEICNFLNLCPSEQYIYTFSYLVASNLLMVYKKDPELAFNLINKVINLFGKCSPIGFLNELNKLNLLNIEQTKEYSELIYKRCRSLK